MKIDILKYVGTWHEILAFPAWFENGLTDITAKYIPMGLYIKIRNSGIDKDGKIVTKVGKAFKTRRSNVLLVQFFWPFKAEYEIHYVDPDYQYAIVGTKRKYLWILARKKSIPKNDLIQLLSKARDLGFDIKRLVKH